VPHGTQVVPHGTVCVPYGTVYGFPVFASSQQAENVDEIGSPALLVVAEREDHGRKEYATPHAIVSMSKNQEEVGDYTRLPHLPHLPHLYINRSNPMGRGRPNPIRFLCKEDHETPFLDTIFIAKTP